MQLRAPVFMNEQRTAHECRFWINGVARVEQFEDPTKVPEQPLIVVDHPFQVPALLDQLVQVIGYIPR